FPEHARVALGQAPFLVMVGPHQRIVAGPGAAFDILHRRQFSLKPCWSAKENFSLARSGNAPILLPRMQTFGSPATAQKADHRRLSHLDRLEAESIHIMREVAAEAERPVMLYSIGKDSAVMLHLAVKAFHPSAPPFPLLHVDTTWKFRAMYEMRER